MKNFSICSSNQIKWCRSGEIKFNAVLKFRFSIYYMTYHSTDCPEFFSFGLPNILTGWPISIDIHKSLLVSLLSLKICLSEIVYASRSLIESSSCENLKSNSNSVLHTPAVSVIFCTCCDYFRSSKTSKQTS